MGRLYEMGSVCWRKSHFILFIPLLIIVLLTAIAIIVYLYTSYKRPLILRRYVPITLPVFGSLSGLTGIVALFYSVGLLKSLFLGLARADWILLHTFGSIILVGVVLVHVYLNFNVFKILFGFYPKRKSKNQ